MEGGLISSLSSMPSWIKHSPLVKTSGPESLLGLGQIVLFSNCEPMPSSSPLFLSGFCALPLSSLLLVRLLLSRALSLFRFLPFLTHIPCKDFSFLPHLQTLSHIGQLLYFIIAQGKDSCFLASSLICFSRISALLNSQGFIWMYSSGPTAGA